MPFKFAWLCDLLQKLESPYLRDTLVLPGPVKEFTQKEIIRWFQSYKNKLNEFEVGSRAVATMLRPEAWTDRDFGLDANGLEYLLARVLSLTKLQLAEISKWRVQPWKGDLAVCVERVMGATKRPFTVLDIHAVTVEEIDQALLKIASYNKGSSLDVQAISERLPQSFCPVDALKDIYTRLEPREAKWLTRLILKTTAPVQVPAEFDIGSHHASLPNILKVHLELPASAPVGITIGGTGVWKGPQQGRKRRLSTPHREDAHVDSRQRRASPGPIVFRRGVLRPIGSTALVNNPMPTPPTSAPEDSAPAVTFSPKRVSPARRSRRSSPGQIFFQQGILTPKDPEVARRNQMLTPVSSHTPATAQATSGAVPISIQPTSLPPTSLPEVAAPQRSSLIGTPLSFPTFKLGLLTPSSVAVPEKKTSNTAPPAAVYVSTSIQPSRSIHRSASTPKHSPKPPFPLTTAGTGSCLGTRSTCPLTNCIFLLGPSLPSNIITFLDSHGSLYTTNLSHLSHPSLPRTCPQTKKKYRRVALINTYAPKESGGFLNRIKELELTRSGGRKKCWVEVYDWRLLGLVEREEKGEKAKFNVWKRCWMCAI